jgi:SAM-dependent methyltransferase
MTTHEGDPQAPSLDAAADALALRVMMYAGSANVAAMIHLGVVLGLYRAMRGRGSLTAGEVAQATGTHERFVLEWLRSQAAAETVDYAGQDRFVLSDAQAAVLVDRDSSLYRAGPFHTFAARMSRLDAVAGSFRTGIGISDPVAAPDTDSLFAAFHRTMLVPVVLPALDGAVDKLRSGGVLADVGCGNGVALIEIAKAFPEAELHGFDPWKEGIAQASAWADEAGVNNVTFHESGAEHLPNDGRFDLMCAFDCIHDMARPAEALAAMRRALKGDGTILIGDIKGEPTFEENVEANRWASASVYSGSVLTCLQWSLSEPGGAGLGTLGFDERTARRMTAEAGFTRFRVLDIEHLVNRFYEVRP